MNDNLKLTYIFHSGFVVETEQCVLVFDYWMDPANVIAEYRKIHKHVYVFSSHFHEDHFTKDIFRWRVENTSARYTYILSKDILKHRRAGKEDADVWLAKGGTWADSNIKVVATGSNDSGVSWVVEVGDRRIFHAGDLCNWYARFLEGETPDKEVYSEEFDEYINPVAEEKRFLGELKDVGKVAKDFDLVMFPVDGRIGNGYTRGARQFIERFKVGLLVPMHFVVSGFESAWRMLPSCEEKGVPFWKITREGDSIVLMDKITIRKATKDDIPCLQKIFATARIFMRQTGNPNQWKEDYPSLELLQNDVESGDSYVISLGNRVVATFVLRGGIDSTYNIIYNGQWIDDSPYATIHRIVCNGEIRGVLHLVMRFALQTYHSIRIDTHRDNKIMQKSINREGFKYCGIIHCWSGEDRLAYQYVKEPKE